MYPSVIEEYFAPTTLADALALLARYPDATVLAGGQSLMQAIKARIVQASIIVDLGRVEELRGIRVDASGIRIGPMTRYRAIHESAHLHRGYGALIDAASHVGDRQVRNRGTIGGSLCWNYIAACMPPTSIAIGAKLELIDSEGQVRLVAAEDFLKGPLETDLQPRELLRAILLPPPHRASGSAYKKVGLGTDALPIACVGILVELDGANFCRKARLAVGGLAEGPIRVPAAEDALLGKAASASLAAEVATIAANTVTAQTDHYASADYRRQLIVSIGSEVIQKAFERAGDDNQ